MPKKICILKKSDFAKVMIFFIIILTVSCTVKHYGFRSPYFSENELIHRSQRDTTTFLKAHLYNGEVYIFDPNWIVDTLTHYIAGEAKIYNIKRNLKDEGYIKLHTDSVAVFESNDLLKVKNNKRLAAKAIITSADVFLGAICLSMPKVCFGSCPTFYVDDDNRIMSARAEGFSNAISPKLSYTDIDDLRMSISGGDTMSLIMKNEALETHVIQDLKILAVPKKYGEYIFHDKKGKFFSSTKLMPLQKVTPLDISELNKLNYEDNHAYRPEADSTNIAFKEEIILEFGITDFKNTGLVVTFRQSLMTTYMLYHAIGYMGNEYSDFMAELETKDHLQNQISETLFGALGGIDIYAYYNEKWHLNETIYETGPIAHNTQISPLDERTEKVKIVMNKGLWSIDYISLATELQQVPATILNNISVQKIAVSIDTLLNSWKTPADQIVSMPGDKYIVKWVIPGTPDFQNAIFLEARGYYIEWMRSNWLQDKNLRKLNTLLNNPKKWLKNQTADYKKYESQMEKDFWNSRYYPLQLVENR